MSNSQAERFIDDGWTVAQFSENISGASAAVFKDAAGQNHLAIRGTELSLNDWLVEAVFVSTLPLQGLSLPRFNSVSCVVPDSFMPCDNGISDFNPCIRYGITHQRYPKNLEQG